MKHKWYLQPWIIAIMFALWIFLIPPVIGIILLILYYKENKKITTFYANKDKQLSDMIAFNEKIGFSRYEDVTNEIQTIRADFEKEKSGLQQEIISLQQNKEQEKQKILAEIQEERESLLQSIDSINADLEKTKEEKNSEISCLNNLISNNNDTIKELNSKILALSDSIQKKEKQLSNQSAKLSRIMELYKSIEYCIENFFNYTPPDSSFVMPDTDLLESEELAPSVILKLHHMDVRDLRKAFKENDKNISTILDQYSKRYTTKANLAIYSLMVIALKSELQNILYNLKYEKLDDCIQEVKVVTSKYLKIAGNGNQSIAGTLTKFIGEIEYLFINAIKIEYNYYVKKEQARQEQAALREQMRQEAAERKSLEEERKKIEIEEEKFNNEIAKVIEQMQNAHDSELEKLKLRILELQGHLSNIVIQKDEITSLQNGKAGTVYIISNLGSFGENVFKVGMTRRLNPQDRVNELGDASVPFKFDVHSFIFSEDAVSLENKMHKVLEEKRVNKVNPRKEFFYTSIDELEQIVNDIEPTAEFNKTMLAEEYRQSISSDENYTSDYDAYENESDE